MAMKRCPVCGERYSDTYKDCPFCEEEEYWEEEQEARRPILRDGGRGSSRARSPYAIVTPILIVLILLMAALLVYLLHGSKPKDKPAPEDNKPGIQTPNTPDDSTPAPDAGGEPSDPDSTGSGGLDGGEMPEGGASGNAGTVEPDGGSEVSGGLTYATAAALPGGLTLSKTDFSRSVSEGDWQLKVSGGTGTYTWISENPAIAKVSSNGTVTPVANGVTNVLVTDGSKKATCIVRVKGGSAPASNGSSGTAAPPSTGTPSTGTTSSGTDSSGTASSGGSLKTGKAVVINGGNGVRVRSGPGTNYDILATVPNGGSVNVVSSAGNDWYEITFSNVGGVTTTGYMKGEFLANA